MRSNLRIVPVPQSLSCLSVGVCSGQVVGVELGSAKREKRWDE